MAQIAGIDMYIPIKIDVLTLLTLNNITTNQQYYNINLRAGPILAVLIHSLMLFWPAAGGMLFTKWNQNIEPDLRLHYNENNK